MLDDDLDYIIGEEDDYDETPEIGIDYGMSDANVQTHMGQCEAPQVRLNPGNKHKIIRKRITGVNYNKSTRILHVTFADGCSLTISE